MTIAADTEEAKRALSEFFIYRTLTPADLAFYLARGYLHYGPILTPRGLEKMRAECMAAWEAEKGPFDPGKSWLQNALLSNIHHRAPIVRDFYFRGPLVEVATQVIGPNVKAATSQLTFKMRGNTLPFDWHQDNSYGQLDPFNAISCLTALDDADEGNGCLWLIPGSVKRGQIAVAPPAQTDATRRAGSVVTLAVDEARAVPVPMKAGECLFFHCWTLHKSGGNFSKDRDRRVLFLRYADADAVEVFNDRRPRLGRLLRGTTRFEEVKRFEAEG